MYLPLLLALTTFSPQDGTRSGLGPQADAVLQRFLSKAQIPCPSGSTIPQGTSERDYFALVDRVSAAMIAPPMDLRPDQSVASMAKRIRAGVDATLGAEGAVSASAKERLYAQGISDWVRTHVCYDKRLLDATGGPLRSSAVKDAHETAKLIRMSKPGTLCGGFALLCRDLARSDAFGIRCEYVAGYLRSTKGKSASKRDHAWVAFTFGDGTVLPTDASGSRVGLEDARRMGGRIRSYLSLPVTAQEWGAFLAFRYASCDDKPILFGDKQNQHRFTSLTLDEWKATDSSPLDPWQRRTMSLMTGATLW